MITESFDTKTPAKINPKAKENRPVIDACIVTFSDIIEQQVLEQFKHSRIGEIHFVTGETPIYTIRHNNKNFAFYKTYVGAPACIGTVEDVSEVIDFDKLVVFGDCGCLDKDIAYGKIIVPTEAYRDEGTSYHYAEASDYITIKNASLVADFMASNGVQYISGKTWTTDAFYRETEGNFIKRKAEGCIAVEMECSALQALCNFRNKELYMFLKSGDLLDAPEWLDRRKNSAEKSQHSITMFSIALKLADEISEEHRSMRSKQNGTSD